jgi:hypothetical protein
MNEFYIGYLPGAPPGIRKRVRIFVLLVFLLTLGGAAILTISQRDFADSSFDFGKPAEFSGTLALRPFPTLIPDRPGKAPDSFEPPYLLVAPGKFGADALLAGRDEEHVRLRGTLIHRGEDRMLEVQPGSLSILDPALAFSSSPKDLGAAKLTGEIVDTKCFLGVMNPGQGKVHRDCAARCLSGGIPPALVSRDLDGASRLLLLLGENGQPLPKGAFLQRVGRPVSIRGQLFKAQGVYYLRTSGASIETLP